MPAITKKRKLSETTSLNDKQIIEHVRKLERETIGSNGDLNKLIELIQIAKSDSPVIIHATIHSIERIFIPLIESGRLKLIEEEQNNGTTIISSWLRAKLLAFEDILFQLFNHSEPGLQIPALKISLELVKAESKFILSQEHTEPFSVAQFNRIFYAMFDAENSLDLQKEFLYKYFNVYDDIRYYSLKALASKGVQSSQEEQESNDENGDLVHSSEIIAERIFSFLEELRRMCTPDNNDICNFYCPIPPKSSKLMSAKSHRKAFSDAWVAALKLPISTERLKKILLMLHKRVIPYMSQPNVLMDFLQDVYDTGGAMSLLALNGVFTLLVEHNLEYPDFYKKLYALFDHDVMHVKYRSRFFRLCDVFLASSHLPAQLVASFIKRMSRLALVAPASAIVTIIPFVYNLLQRHPRCMVMIHRIDQTLNLDPFDMCEPDPMLTNAIDSSIWELATMQNHYHPSVAMLAKILSEPFTKQTYLIEDFLDHTYTSMFDAEVGKKIKKEPAVTFVPDGQNIDSLFGSDDIFSYSSKT